MAKFSDKDPLPKLKALFLKARDLYYNDPQGRTLMSDKEFDALEDLIRDREPRWDGLKKTGIEVKNKKTKVKLPVPMASLDKVKIDSVQRWIDSRKTDEAVVSDKLDGSALELVITKGVPTFLATRGTGVIGGDISFMIPHLKIPKNLGTSSCVLRCEGLFSQAVFQKYKSEFKADRNAASGIFNNQSIHKATKDISIVVLKVLKPDVKPSEGLRWAKAKGFQVVPHRVVPFSQLTGLRLTSLLEKRRAVSKYRIDGLVIEENKVNRITADKPDWAKAFKSNVSAEEAPVSTVLKVHWDTSPRAQLIPRIQFKPIDFDGTKVSFASAHNAKYVNTHRLGVGAKVSILRSGDIIPYIVRVEKPAPKISKPDPQETGAYKLDVRGTNYVLDKPAESRDFRIQRMLKFFKTLEIDFFKLGTVTKLYDLGFSNLTKLLRASPADFQRAGLTPATSLKLHTALHSILDKGVPLSLLMDASGTFPHGMGRKRFDNLEQHYPLIKLLKASADKQELAINRVPGFGGSTTQAFIKGAPKFLKWLDLVQIPVASGKKASVKQKSNLLKGMGITWTSYRDKEQEQIVMENGGTVVSFGGKTNVLLYRPGGKESTKLDTARSKGIPVMTWEKFARKYGI